MGGQELLHNFACVASFASFFQLEVPRIRSGV